MTNKPTSGKKAFKRQSLQSEEEDTQKTTLINNIQKSESSSKKTPLFPFTPFDKTKPLYTLEEVEDILKVSRRTLYSYIEKGKLKAVRQGNEYRIKYQDLDTYIMELKYSKPKRRKRSATPE